MKTLITFLGKSFNNKEGQYTKIEYKFNGEKLETSYFGLSLAEKLGVEKLIVLGTSGSGWDNLWEYHHEVTEENLEEICEIGKKVNDNIVQEEDLHRLKDIIKPLYNFTEIELKLIPYATTKDEQYELLRIISDSLNKNDNVTIDISHSFRYISIFSFVASLYLRDVQGINVENVYCGTENGDVINLNEMLNVVDWVKALAIYDHTADYSKFDELFENIGVENFRENELKKASYAERTFNTKEAEGYLENLETTQCDNKLFGLFKNTLIKRISWFKLKSRFEKELQLAQIFLDKKDYLRAATYLYEGICSKTKGESSEFIKRNETIENFIDKQNYRDIIILKEVRNKLVHGSRGQQGNWNNADEVKKIIKYENELKKFLQKVLNYYK